MESIVLSIIILQIIVNPTPPHPLTPELSKFSTACVRIAGCVNLAIIQMDRRWKLWQQGFFCSLKLHQSVRVRSRL